MMNLKLNSVNTYWGPTPFEALSFGFRVINIYKSGP